MFQKIYVYKTPLLCNAKCGFCLSKATQTSKMYNVPIKKIIKEFLEIKKSGFKTVILVGGESTIIDNLKDYIIIAKKLWLEIIITTNGIVFSDYEYLKYLKSIGLNHIIFSFHSNIEEEHDLLVGVPWAFKHITKAIHNAKDIWFKHISISTVICSYNDNKLSDIIHYCRENFNIYINNFCNLEISYNNRSDYNKKSYLFPNLENIRSSILEIDKIFKWSTWSIALQNLPLCAFDLDTFYLTHEHSGKERYYEKDFELDFEMNHRIKNSTCDKCSLKNKCKWFFPYFDENNIIKFT